MKSGRAIKWAELTVVVFDEGNWAKNGSDGEMDGIRSGGRV